MEQKTVTEQIQTASLEMLSGHNDGWVTQGYYEQMQEWRKMIDDSLNIYKKQHDL